MTVGWKSPRGVHFKAQLDRLSEKLSDGSANIQNLTSAYMQCAVTATEALCSIADSFERSAARSSSSHMSSRAATA